MKTTTLISVTFFATGILLNSACSGTTKKESEGTPIQMRHARNITMQALGDSVTMVTLTNPWDSVKTMAKYLLVERGYSATETLPKDAVIIHVPLQSTIVFSGVHASLITEFGVSDAIKGVCDAEYINDRFVKSGLADGSITDCGPGTMPVTEKIVRLKPDALLLSPFENSDETTRFSRLGINVILTADYMETTPLGRAEWVRFYGRLFGKSEKADSLFDEVEKNYKTLKKKAEKVKAKPSVLFDRPYGGIWDVPTSGSVTGILINDAGGSNPFSKYNQGGSAHLSPEEVVHTARKSDIWLVRHIEPNLSMKDLANENTLFTKIKAYRNGNVYGADTMNVTLFDDGAFHPNKVLLEMVLLLHPEICNPDEKLRYYKKLN